jgi:hypothetical protein
VAQGSLAASERRRQGDRMEPPSVLLLWLLKNMTVMMRAWKLRVGVCHRIYRW